MVFKASWKSVVPCDLCENDSNKDLANDLKLLSLYNFLSRGDPLQLVEGSYKAHIQVFNDKIAMNNGYFTFRADDPSAPNGEKRIPARFTFLYQKNPATGQWDIVNHHNSVMPTAPPGLLPGYACKGPEILSKEQKAQLTQEVLDTTKLWVDTVTSGAYRIAIYCFWWCNDP